MPKMVTAWLLGGPCRDLLRLMFDLCTLWSASCAQAKTKNTVWLPTRLRHETSNPNIVAGRCKCVPNTRDAAQATMKLLLEYATAAGNVQVGSWLGTTTQQLPVSKCICHQFLAG